MEQASTISQHSRRMLFAQRLIVCVVGIAIISLSSAVCYLTRLGSDPYQVLAVSLHLQLGISYGMANNLLNGSVILLMLLFKRRYLRLSLFLCLLISGTLVDLFTGLLTPVITPDVWLPIRVTLAVGGCVLLAFGVFLYISPDLGASPADSVGIILSDMTKIPYSTIRVGTDAFYALAGTLLGGPLGLVTVLSVILTGPCIGFFQRLWGKHHWITRLHPDKAA